MINEPENTILIWSEAGWKDEDYKQLANEIGELVKNRAHVAFVGGGADFKVHMPPIKTIKITVEKWT